MAEPWVQEVEGWLRRRTITQASPTPHELAALKAATGLTISVCLPALDEAATIGPICSAIRRDLQATGVVDELLVMDSGSTDGTPELATQAGAKVHATESLLPELAGGRHSGKGDALWKSLAVASGDLVVWLDADIRDFDPQFVTRLVEPLLKDPTIAMTKAFYKRPPPEGSEDATGGRVTELGARPLLRLLYPRLSGVIQPLSGEYALRRKVALELPFVTGYGVDAALLIDLVQSHGLDSLAQVDLGTRVHRNRELLALGRTSFQVMQAILVRLRALGLMQTTTPFPADLLQFEGSDGRAFLADAGVHVRPPMSTVLRPAG